MLQKIFSLFALITISFVSSQNISTTNNICFFQDAKTGLPITIINDSLVYKGELKNPSILKHTNYPGVLNDYQYHFIVNNRNYLVHAGCGPVLEYRNDSIVRIDNSFMQKNQYGASPFVYKNQICLFGGYGMFTAKNIITQFDFKDREWFRLFPRGKEEPNPRCDNLNYNNYYYGFYLFGGWTNSSLETFEKDSSLWVFNFATLQWNRLGNYNENLIKIISKAPYKYFTFQTDKKLYIQNTDLVIEIDFINNKINYFENKKILPSIKPYFDNKSSSLVYLQFLSGADYLKLKTIKLSDLLKRPIKSEKLYNSRWQDYVYYIIWIIVALLIIFGVYKCINYQKNNYFVYLKSKNNFYFKSKKISNLDPLEEKILIYLFQNDKAFIQLNQLNNFFEKESPNNFNNIVKKRDLVFATLLVKLNAIVSHEEKPLVLIQKNEVDKRIKEIKLNPQYFKIK